MYTYRCFNTLIGGPLEDPNQVEDRIRQAQIAVLNPAVDPDVILGGEEPTGGLSFTKNCVVVKLRGRELADLSFVDLPGGLNQLRTGPAHIEERIHRYHCQHFR
jgi:hypothetical protein